MKNIASALWLVLGIASVAQEALAAGALAINGKQGAKYGWAIDYPSIKLAEEQALKKCGDGCNVIFTFTGGAAAYAADQSAGSTIYGWGRAASADQAKQIALEETKKRGATKPIVRVWGVESGKNKINIDSNNFKVKVLVRLKLKLENGNDVYAKGGWAQFVGWTYATKDELVQYGQKSEYVTYSDDVTGSRIHGNFLLTPEGQGGTPDSSPIMNRFVNNVVHKHPLYSKRKVDKFSNDVMNMWSYPPDWKFNYFAYDGAIIIIDGNWTYEQLKNSVTFYEQEKGGYTIVDAGEF